MMDEETEHQAAGELTSEVTTPMSAANTDTNTDLPESGPNKSCRFLRLPAEIRNHIYGYLAEDLDDLCLSPYVGLVPASGRIQSWEERLWKCVGMTQVCTMIRKEYKPFWLRNFELRTAASSAGDLIMQFLIPTLQYNTDIELLQVEWRDGVSPLQGYDITPFMLLHALCPDTRITFIADRILKTLNHADPCVYCEFEMRREAEGLPANRNPHIYCRCGRVRSHTLGRIAIASRDTNVTWVIRHLIEYTDDTWRELVRQHRIKVRIVDTDRRGPKFYVTCRSWTTLRQNGVPYANALHTNQDIRTLLQSVGLGTQYLRYIQYVSGENVTRVFTVGLA